VKRKICVVITARASYAKFKTIMTALHADERVELQVVCAASAVLGRFGDVSSVIKSDGFNVNDHLNFLIEGEDLLSNSKSAGYGLIEFSTTFARLNPDIVVVMADRFEVLSAAMASAYQNIPLAHIQGGEVSGNIDEKVRHAITKLADYHFPATAQAKEWLIRMGEAPENIYHFGCPSIDIARGLVIKNQGVMDIYNKYGGVGCRPNLENGYYIVMQHPVTSEQNELEKNIYETLLALEASELPVIWFWPNSDAGSEAVAKVLRIYREKYKPENIHFIKNMDPEDFLLLLKNSSGIIGNSSAGIREASFFGIPAINIGNRQANRERGKNVVDTPYDHKIIKNAIKSHLGRKISSSSIYGQGNAGYLIAEKLATEKLRFTKSLNYVDGLNGASQ